MKTWEAMKLLDEGKKIRRSRWGHTKYIYKDRWGAVRTNNDIVMNISQLNLTDWELYVEEARKEIPESMNWLKDLYNNHIINNNIFDCSGIRCCKDCPLHIEVDRNPLCRTIRGAIPEIKEKFKIEEER